MDTQEPEGGLVNDVVTSLATFGVNLQPRILTGHDGHHDLEAELSRGSSRATVTVHVMRAPSLASLALRDGDLHSPVLVVADYISVRTADALRKAGANYADASGNTWIRFGDVLIDVRGRKRRVRNEMDWPQQWPTKQTGNLFSAGRSQVVCALLAWPGLWAAPTREIARSAGVSVGLAHDALNLLRDARYDVEDSVGHRRLLDLWAAAFPAGLARRIHLADYRGDIDQLWQDGEEMYVGGESAVPDLIRATTLTVYVRDLRPELVLANRWRTDRLPNITVRSVFWHDPQGHRGEQQMDGKSLAPWPLVYADLFSSDDPRLRTAADAWRARFV